mmetsp:Transcript_14324/g.45549  ORF Transcript_14324/g.45549 Transcript_14324/m.45549 type:complete len:343 (-) Transcript_14324:808-1836(-)
MPRRRPAAGRPSLIRGSRGVGGPRHLRHLRHPVGPRPLPSGHLVRHVLPAGRPHGELGAQAGEDLLVAPALRLPHLLLRLLCLLRLLPGCLPARWPGRRHQCQCRRCRAGLLRLGGRAQGLPPEKTCARAPWELLALEHRRRRALGWLCFLPSPQRGVIHGRLDGADVLIHPVEVEDEPLETVVHLAVVRVQLRGLPRLEVRPLQLPALLAQEREGFPGAEHDEPVLVDLALLVLVHRVEALEPPGRHVAPPALPTPRCWMPFRRGWRGDSRMLGRSSHPPHQLNLENSNRELSPSSRQAWHGSRRSLWGRCWLRRGGGRTSLASSAELQSRMRRRGPGRRP